MSPNTDMDAFRTVLRKSKNIVAIAGAGLSAASGIPTFRGAGGLWRRYDAIKLATPEAFEKDPSLVWQFYHMRREKAAEAQPNAAHLALAQLFKAEVLQQISPQAKFTLVTQNVDGLSTRALRQVLQIPTLTSDNVPSESKLYEMHGRVHDTICTQCKVTKPNYNSPICEGLRGTEIIVDSPVAEPVIPLTNLPRCDDCGGLLRPGVVWFTERPLYLDEIDSVVEDADLALVVGTSSTVYPAAGYADDIKDNGGKVAVFNLDPSQNDREADFLFAGPCDALLPKALFGDSGVPT